MAHYSMGQVEKISGVKSTTLRRWEESGMVFRSLKGYSGHRVYSQRDLEIVLRLKYLIYTKKLTVQSAKAKIIDDASCVQQIPEKNAVFAIRQIRAALCELFFELQRLKKIIASSTKATTRCPQGDLVCKEI